MSKRHQKLIRRCSRRVLDEFGKPARFLKQVLLASCLMLAVDGLCASAPVNGRSSQPPASPREFYNAGAQLLRQGKLREAEASFETVLASQLDRFQPSALYNLGHVRFNQGVEELKKGPAARPAASRGRTMAQMAADASRSAEDALASKDVQKMVEAYMNGRGIRRELKEATKAVKRALETHGVALNKWQRSAGDFKSTVELNPNDADARQNAETVDRSIAKLVDSLRELQQAANMMGNKSQELKDKLDQLKGQIPAPNMPPGAAGDEEEEEEEMPKGQQQGQKEGASKDGEELSLSPEQAGWLLEGFKLDTERRLPMGQNDTAEPKDSKRRPW